MVHAVYGRVVYCAWLFGRYSNRAEDSTAVYASYHAILCTVPMIPFAHSLLFASATSAALKPDQSSDSVPSSVSITASAKKKKSKEKGGAKGGKRKSNGGEMGKSKSNGSAKKKKGDGGRR
jgi:hypothetical protein